MPLTMSYDYHGMLCPRVKLTIDEYAKFTQNFKPTSFKTFHILVNKLKRSLRIVPRNKYIGEITPEIFQDLLSDLVAKKIITETAKQQYVAEFTAQYKILPRIGKDHSNYATKIGRPFSAKYVAYRYNHPKAAQEMIFLEKQKQEFANNKIIVDAIDAWSLHFKILALLKEIHIASGLPRSSDLLNAAKAAAIKNSEKLPANKFATGESSLTDWLYTGLHSDGIMLTKEQFAAINSFLENNPELLPLFRLLALWSVFGVDSRLDDPKISALRNQLHIILFAASHDKAVRENFPELHGQYNLEHTIFARYEEKLTNVIANIIHEMMHAIISLLHDYHSRLPEKSEQHKTAWQETIYDSLQRITSITPRPEIEELLDILDFTQYAKSFWQGELISRTTEVKSSYPDLEILLNKSSRNFLRKEIENLCQQATIQVQNFYDEAGLRLIKAFQKEFFSSFNPIQVDAFESALLNEAFNNKQTILDCFINKKLQTVTPGTLITYLHTVAGISEIAILMSAARNGRIEMVETLFNEFKYDFNHPSVIKAFNLAVKNNHFDIVKLFIAHKIDVNCSYEQQLTPLHYATAFGHVSLVQLLMKNGANVNAVDRDGNTLLHWAAKNGHLELVKYFSQISAKLLTEKNQQGETALHLAVQNDHFAVADYLLLQDSSLASETTLTGDIPLHLAAAGGHINIIKLLLEKKVNINAVNVLGHTPIFAAVKKRQLKSAVILKNSNPDITIASKNTLTPLHLAAASQQVDILFMLLNFSTQGINQKTCTQDTPLHLAAKTGNVSLCSTLVTFGAELNLKNNKEATPLHLAVMAGSEDTVKLFLDKGANINAETSKGSTALHLVMANKKNNLIKIFTSNNKVDIHTQDEEGNTALHCALLCGNFAGAKILIEACKDRIDVSLSNKKGETPLSLAEQKNQDIANLLKSVKAKSKPLFSNNSTFFKAEKESVQNDDEFQQKTPTPKKGSFMQGA